MRKTLIWCYHVTFWGLVTLVTWGYVTKKKKPEGNMVTPNGNTKRGPMQQNSKTYRRSTQLLGELEVDRYYIVFDKGY